MSKKRKRKSANIHIVPADVINSLPTLNNVDNVSTDGRRIKRQTHLAYAPPVNPQQQANGSLSAFADPSFLADNDWSPELRAQVDAAVNGEDTESTHVQIEGTETRRFATLVSTPQSRGITAHLTIRVSGT